MAIGTPAIATPIAANLGGTGIANNAASTLAISGNFGTTFTVSGATALTLPTSGTLTTTANTLAVFAATTSAQLAGVISDDTGSGALVFANTPTLVTPNIGVATGTALTLTQTTQQLSLNYDGTNKATFAIGSGGKLTINSNNLGTCYEWQAGGTVIAQLSIVGATGVMTMGYGANAAYTVATQGNFSSTKVLYDVTGNPNATATGITYPAASTLGLATDNVTRFKVSNTAATITSGISLVLGNAATTGLAAGILAATTNATIVITDSTGQAYRIPCII